MCSSVFKNLPAAAAVYGRRIARDPYSCLVALTATQVSLRNRSQDTGDLRETLEVVESQMLRLRRVVDDMFTLAQADTGVYEPTIDPILPG